MTFYEFADKHPLWTLLYLAIISAGIVGALAPLRPR